MAACCNELEVTWQQSARAGFTASWRGRTSAIANAVRGVSCAPNAVFSQVDLHPPAAVAAIVKLAGVEGHIWKGSANVVISLGGGHSAAAKRLAHAYMHTMHHASGAPPQHAHPIQLSACGTAPDRLAQPACTVNTAACIVLALACSRKQAENSGQKGKKWLQRRKQPCAAHRQRRCHELSSCLPCPCRSQIVELPRSLSGTAGGHVGVAMAWIVSWEGSFWLPPSWAYCSSWRLCVWACGPCWPCDPSWTCGRPFAPLCPCGHGRAASSGSANMTPHVGDAPTASGQTQLAHWYCCQRCSPRPFGLLRSGLRVLACARFCGGRRSGAICSSQQACKAHAQLRGCNRK
jgi:hypothetical protein